MATFRGTRAKRGGPAPLRSAEFLSSMAARNRRAPLRLRSTCLARISIGAALLMAGCGNLGKVEQGRVIAYDRRTQRVTLIREANRKDPSSLGVLPPVTIEAPADPGEMGPAPAAGGLIRLDDRKHRIVIYDRTAQSFRTVPYEPLEEHRGVAKHSGAPVVDRAKKTITVYAAAEQALITFSASDELLAIPPDTWQTGDVVRYYYKNPARALRLMNVTQTDLSKSN